MVDQATTQRYSSPLCVHHQVGNIVKKYLILLPLEELIISLFHKLLFYKHWRMQVVTAVFLKQGVPQPSYAVLIRWAGVATSAGSTDMKLKWTYTRVFRLFGFLTLTLVLLRCPYYSTNLKYSIVGLER